MGTCQTSIPENILGKPEPALVLCQHQGNRFGRGRSRRAPWAGLGKTSIAARNLSSLLLTNSGSPDAAGRKCRRLVGLAGLRAAARRRFGTAGGRADWATRRPNGPTSARRGRARFRSAASAEPTQRGRGAGDWAHGLLLREHRHRGRYAAPAGHPQAGPAGGR